MSSWQPYHVHQQGSEEAWGANLRLQESRNGRLERIAQAIADGKEPKHRDVRPHRRTLAHRTRKRSNLSLTITDRGYLKSASYFHRDSFTPYLAGLAYSR